MVIGQLHTAILQADGQPIDFKYEQTPEVAKLIALTKPPEEPNEETFLSTESA